MLLTNAIVERSDATRQIEDTIAAIDAILNQRMDNLVPILTPTPYSPTPTAPPVSSSTAQDQEKTRKYRIMTHMRIAVLY